MYVFDIYNELSRIMKINIHVEQCANKVNEQFYWSRAKILGRRVCTFNLFVNSLGTVNPMGSQYSGAWCKSEVAHG